MTCDLNHDKMVDANKYTITRYGVMNTSRRKQIMEKATRELVVEEIEDFDLADLEFLLETATEELEPRVTPDSAIFLPPAP